MSAVSDLISVVVLTYNRAEELRRTLDRLQALPEQVRIIVADNASTDGTAAMMAKGFPAVEHVVLPSNIGAAARNAGVLRARTPYVAFCDDDTWWEGGSLAMAVDMLERYPKVAVLSAKVLIGEEMSEDPTCALMAKSPLPADGLPGPSLLGFLAGASVARRKAFLDAGGYEPNFFIGGEEELLALDLLSAGWRLCYAPQLTVHHCPSPVRDDPGRRHLLKRNAFWVIWLRLPLADACRATLLLLRKACRNGVTARDFLAALRGLPWVVRNRRVLPDEVLSLYRFLRF